MFPVFRLTFRVSWPWFAGDEIIAMVSYLASQFQKKISRKMIQAKVAQKISGPEECRIYRSKYWPIGRPLVRCIQKFLIPLLTPVTILSLEK